jgi:hypothetical protein
MSRPEQTELRKSAAEKMKTGGLMTLGEVAALMDVSPVTVHGLPLASMRVGRCLRFDPKDVSKMLEASKEPSVFSLLGIRMEDVKSAAVSVHP